MRSFAATLVVVCVIGSAIGAPSPDPQLGGLLDGLSMALNPVLHPVVQVLNILTSPLGGVSGTLGTLNSLTNGLLGVLLAPLSPLTTPLGLGVPASNLSNSLSGLLNLLPAINIGTPSNNNMSSSSMNNNMSSRNVFFPSAVNTAPLASLLPILSQLLASGGSGPNPLSTFLSALAPLNLG